MWTRGISYLTLAIVLLAGLSYLIKDYRAKAVPEREMLPVVFDHSDHKEVKCAKCHHNFVDDTGGGTCYVCHKFTPEIAFEMEEMFHTLCRDCHVETRHKGEDSGPLRECSGCHQVESHPEL